MTTLRGSDISTRYPGKEVRGRIINLRELGLGVEDLAGTVKVMVAHTVGVVVTAVGIALSGETVFGVGTTAVVGLADVVLVGAARVRGQSERVSVGLPVKTGQLFPFLQRSDSPTKHQSRHSKHRTGRHRRWRRWWRAPSLRRWPCHRRT